MNRPGSYRKYADGVCRPRLRPCPLLAVLAVALLNSGCLLTGPLEWVRNGFKVGPNYGRPPAPVAAEWIEAEDPRVQRALLRDGNWWEVFQDPILNSLAYRAYQQSPSLRAVGMRVLQARAQQAIAAGSFFPQVQEATGEHSRVNLSHNTFNNPSVFTAFATKPPPPGALIGNFFSDWTLGFNLSWELDFWGRIRRSIESATANLDVSIENYDDALVTTLADVATNYVQYRITQQRIEIARANLRTQEKLVAVAEQQKKVGTATTVDEQQLRTLMEQTRSTIPALRIVLGQANDRLCILLGQPIRDLGPELGPGPELDSYPMPATPAWVAAGIPGDLLRRRPDVRSAERQVAAQNPQIGVAEAELYPTFFIDGTIGWEAADLAKLFESRSFAGSITPRFKWNILNYGRIVNNVRLQDARTQELVASYQNKVLIAAGEVQTALRGFLESQEQARDLGRSAAAAVAATKVQEKLFAAVKADVNRLFTLESSQLQAQDQLAVAQGNIALNLIAVYRALGGGWQIRNRDGGDGVNGGGGHNRDGVCPARLIGVVEQPPADLPDRQD